VTKIYGSNRTAQKVLDEVSFDVDAGTLTALVGHSGSGKSTLLSVAGGLEPPTAGVVSVCGTEIQNMTAAQATAHRARTVSYVFQEWNLIRTLTVVENVCLPLNLAGWKTAAARKRASEVLELVGVAQHSRKFPDHLSGGEQQRVAIARAVADRRPLLLADEPTGALDSDNGTRVVELLRSIVDEHQAACVVATHNPEVAAACDRVLRIANGSLAGES
jgi:putative ABC transport system ATP-binding protein